MREMNPDFDATEIEFSKEEIQEIRRLQIDYERKQKNKKMKEAMEAKEKLDAKLKANKLYDFWNDDTQSQLKMD